MNDEYAAGLVDGEGCISLSLSGKRTLPTFHPRVDIGMGEKALPLLTKMQLAYGGSIRRTRPATTVWQAAWTWSVFGPAAAGFLRIIRHGLLLKREQADLLIEFQERLSRERGSQAKNTRWSDSLRAEGQRVYDRIQTLNMKGPAAETDWVATLVNGRWVAPQASLMGDVPFTAMPKSGSMRSGELFAHQTWALPIDASDCSPLLPTPDTVQGGSPAQPRAARTPEKPSAIRLEEALRYQLLSSPSASDAKGPSPNHAGTTSEAIAALLPTPRPTRGGSSTETQLLLPTPRTSDANGGGQSRNGRNGSENVSWGAYEPAIRRWERLTRPAPAPVDERGRLCPRFVEWMQGFEDGFVTDLLPRTAALRCLGNAVVPQVAEWIGSQL